MGKGILRKIILYLVLVVIGAGGSVYLSVQKTADVIYFGGDIVTVNDAQPMAEAVAIKEGKIFAVGNKVNVFRLKGNKTRVVDLTGKTLLPGFIDAHSHFVEFYSMVGWVNVSSPPVGPVTDIPSLIAALQEHVKKNKPAKGEWIFAYGYDMNQLKEKRDITVDDLDPYFPDNPLMIFHVSCHGAVLNSAALTLSHITASTQTPFGGVISRKPDSNQPAGLIMETAFFPVWAGLPQPGDAVKLNNLKAALDEYASNGYTTVQEGATSFQEYQFIHKAAEQGLLFLDLIALPIFSDLDKFFSQKDIVFGKYDNRLKLGGVKFLIDGSPQGRTAYFTKPYLTGGPSGQENWYGEPSMPQELFFKLIKEVVDRGIITYTHANGDAAIDLVIKALKDAGVKASQDRRDVMVHSQFMRPEQLDSYVELGVVPSFFTGHAFYWGDTHVQNLGEERAFFLSPMKSAKEKGLRFSNHTDSMVTPLNPMMPLWSAVARLSRSGKIIGPDQRVSVLDSLRALTIDAAYQYHEEKIKGSIEKGKLADFVVLDKNPLKISTDDLPKLKVLKTIKEGRTVFQAR